MSRLQVITAKKFEKILLLLGFKINRQKGSHVFYRHADGRSTTLPHHSGEDYYHTLNYSTMKKLYTIILFALLANISLAQKQTYQWYFSNTAAMDFNSGTSVSVDNSVMNQFEGSSSIADENGNLLFYTDGLTVWNKNHVPMPNGTGMKGNYSSTQSALIVPKPGSSTLYYIFVCDGATAHYSELDITLNGGLGDVTALKNVTMNNNCAEKLAGVRAANGLDYWIAIKENNNAKFKAYQFTSAGLSTAVTSTVGNQLVGNIGQLQFSPDGKLAAMASYSSPTLETVDLFQFDNATGIFSNHIGMVTTYFQTYGLEFSPNSKVLYSGANPGVNTVHQWDLSVYDSAAIKSSDYLVGSTLGDVGSLQLGPDGKVYVAQTSSIYVGAINNPDVIGGGCNWVNTGVNLSPNTMGLGLPNFVSSFFVPISAEFFCYGDATHFLISDSAGFQNAYWNFDDPASGAANVDSGASVFHVFTDTGSYTVQVVEDFGYGISDTIYKTITIIPAPIVSLGNDTSLCTGDSLLIDAG
ncbi:MAG: type II toxin-antitoxin system HicA family toxin, partial [Chitinophagales bacterium]|nr:type II toxin-antitoxin system HicA family toxin [Chitinophagales bacterium]